MADIFDPTEPSSTLLCDEGKDLCFEDPEANPDHHDHDHGHDDHHNGNDNQSRSSFNAPGSEPLMHLQALSEEGFASMVERERDYFPKHDYLTRLRSGELDLGARREALDWIWKAHSYHNFGPLSFCLAVNYLDRFLSIRDLPIDKDWAVQLLAVACLSIAAKVEETTLPPSVDLQVEDPKFMFAARTIQRMELLVLDTLDWKMNAVTACSFLDYSLKKLSDSYNNKNDDKNSLSSTTTTKVVNRSMQLILCTFKGIDFLEFKPSEIAVSVATFVSADEFQAVDINSSIIISSFTHLEKDRVLNCIEKIKSMINANKKRKTSEEVEESPVGVLDAECFSCKSDELTVKVASSCPNTTTTVSSKSSPDHKRKKV